MKTKKYLTVYLTEQSRKTIDQIKKTENITSTNKAINQAIERYEEK